MFGLSANLVCFTIVQTHVGMVMRLKIGLSMVIVGLWSLTAQASYVESCEIAGKVLQDTSTRRLYLDGPQGDYEVLDLRVVLRVQKVKQSGRADSQCAAFKPRTPLEISIKPAPLVTLQQGQNIRIHYFKKHNQGQEATESYQLLQP